jgi:hypothetical protein
MCDNCREHDRENRKNKKLRDLGQLPPIRFATNMGVLKKGGKSKGVSKNAVSIFTGTSEPPASSTAPVVSTLPGDSPSSARTSSSNDADEVHTDRIHPDGSVNNVSTL